jgi:hypothetical protein
MDLTSTPFLSYREITTEGIDLIDDAWGFYPQFHDVIDILKLIKAVPGKRLTHRLIGKIRKNY